MMWISTGAAFYGAMRRGAVVKTSMVNPDLMANYFERALSQGDDVLYVGMSGGISGTAQAAVIAAGELTGKYPARKIVTIDTYAASLGEGLQVLEAAHMIEEGKSLDEIKAHLLSRRPHMCQFFTVDDLAYLKRGGRISSATALIGTVLSIKPILRGDETGHIVSCGKVRGMKRAYQELANYYDGRALDKSEMLGIAHADNEEGRAGAHRAAAGQGLHRQMPERGLRARHRRPCRPGNGGAVLLRKRKVNIRSARRETFGRFLYGRLCAKDLI